ncbi:hypothetical protein BD311DRAFT_707237, partial [Dichomitus squalens]
MADQLADIGREKEEEWDLDYAIPDHWRVDGARLAALNQKLAYQILIHKKVPKPGSCSDTTRNNIEYTKDEVERVTGIRPTEKQIWKGISKKPIQRKKTDFLWKLLHDRVRCGKYFKHIPGWEDKQYCQCGEIENPEHVLTECELTSELWDKIAAVWTATAETKWTRPTRGIIQGIGSLRFMNEQQQEMHSDTYYYKVLIMEAAWELWKYR